MFNPSELYNNIRRLAVNTIQNQPADYYEGKWRLEVNRCCTKKGGW